MSRVDVGDPAPDFDIPGTGNRNYKLSDCRGKAVVLVFYPGDATPVCTQQLRSYTADFDQFAQLDAVLFGLSPQDIESHESFRIAHNLVFPLLFDEGKKVGEKYGVLGPLGFYRRSVFVVDSAGRLSYAKRALTGVTFVKTDELIEAVEAATI